MFFCAVETTSGLWASTYLHQARGMSAADAAMGASMFYGAITLGRLLTGFVANRLSGAKLIRIGQCVCLAGAAVVALPAPPAVAMLGIAVIGLGTSPIYPSMLHETPRRFGAENSQAVVGLQMAFAYIGSTLVPPLFGSAGLRDDAAAVSLVPRGVHAGDARRLGNRRPPHEHALNPLFRPSTEAARTGPPPPRAAEPFRAPPRFF